MLPGELRTEVWNALARARQVSYPLPPHGHHPNFRGARTAGANLLAHPRVAGLRVLVVGPERALFGARKLALAEGRVLFVPHPHRAGRYWRLTSPAAASLSKMAALGEEVGHPQGAQGVIIACVAASRDGGRLSKGFGWASRGLFLGVPEFTLAHPMMLRASLPCEPDSRVALVATPREVVAPDPPVTS